MRSLLVLLVVAVVSVPSLWAESLEPARAAVDAVNSNASRFYLDRKTIDAVVAGAPQTEDARKAARVISSPDFQQKVEKERVRVQQEFFRGTKEGNGAYYAAPQSEEKVRLASDERVYLFVSSSMPEATLRRYVEDIARLEDPNIVIVMRGFIGGMDRFQPTMKFIADLLKKDRNCDSGDCPTHQVAFDIDPNLYRRFKPSQVPALVYARGVTLAGPGVSEGVDGKGASVPTNPWWVIYGDASLSYLFSRVAEDADSAVLAGFADDLR